MRILCVHNRYQQHGGEDQVYDSETTLLEEHGHHVTRLEFDNADIPDHPSAPEAFNLAVSTVWSRESARIIRESVLASSAEVVHFTNTFPLVSPSVYSAAKSARAATVQTVQNYRTACPSSNFFRDHRICEDCLGHLVPWPGVVHACYRESRAQSAVVASMIAVHRLRKTWHQEVDLFVAATEFSRQKLIEGGLPADRIRVKPNFLDIGPLPDDAHQGDFCLYAGRLVEEKGVLALLEAWESVGFSVPLRIAGLGPLEDTVHDAAERNSLIRPLGGLTRWEILDQMRQAKLLIFPSIWYEGLPVTLVEAMGSGLPVIASRLGAMAEVINDGHTGLHFHPNDPIDLAAKVEWAWSHPEEMRTMGANARKEYERIYTPQRNYALLMQIYAEVINKN